jgi:CelD/BcsL family acetyltransferase involved in cellulose biosynthesis
LQAQLLQPSEIDAAVLAQWVALARRAVDPNPWFEPHVVLPLARLRDDMAILVTRSAEGLRACLPLIRATRRRRGLPTRVWTTPHPMGSPLVDAETADSALDCAFTCLARARGPRLLVLQEMAAEGAATSAVQRVLAAGWRHAVVPPRGHWPAVYRRPQPTYLEESAGAKQRHNLSRCRRRLEEKLQAELQLVDRAGEEAAVERFLRLEASGWKGRRGTALACDPLWTDYFRKACRGFAGEGRLRLLCLEAGATTVAMKVMIRAGAGLFEFRVAYDERFSCFSPGVLLEVAALRDFHDGRDAWVLSNTNHARSPLLRVWPDRCATTSVLAECRGTAAHLAGSLRGLLSRIARPSRPRPLTRG